MPLSIPARQTQQQQQPASPPMHGISLSTSPSPSGSSPMSRSGSFDVNPLPHHRLLTTPAQHPCPHLKELSMALKRAWSMGN
ncbi:hypothetical protein TREMEDRAFT_56803 [Tremella mesenterica DSM 1558]|uniref:uncharacterized protein n=1 Tax=Tremella mesenterica (strain ATCC 24925 / CBS 8224 / DSM 1558 / NBRC 9311 / NRRL Y-6157 / RJB 2259-6 / UBC 559-6) TaxID=578456 RepID=UPI0003F48E6F|nr:uncharacterized protein TREMEDRAFT_56803 [Tremella mesenterica DSM 1558]EIW70078.1 hypothetical protein TREMEDRAFT_56803 [Tremella mesenterica DSM 1558]